MKKTTIDIPIYKCELTMVLDKDLKYVEKEYKTISLDDFGAVTLRHQFDFRHIIVAFTDKKHLSNIAHEIVHIKNYVFTITGAKLDTENDEAEAYLTGWLFDEIYNFLYK